MYGSFTHVFLAVHFPSAAWAPYFDDMNVRVSELLDLVPNVF